MKIEGLEKLNEVLKELKDSNDFYEIIYCGVTDEPKGSVQSTIGLWEHEYVDQKTGYACDDYYGNLYIPVGDDKHYFHFFYRA